MIDGKIFPPRQAGGFSKEIMTEAREKGELLSIWLNLSNICNLSCQYCFNSAGKPLPGEMDLDLLISTVRQLKALGGRTVTIPGSGEPLLDKNFWPLLEEINGLGMSTVLFTNGILLDEECAKKLYDRNVTVVLKINSFDEDVHDSLVGRKGHAKKVKHAIDILFKQGFNKTDPSRFSIANSIFTTNAGEIEAMYRWARENNIIPRISTLLEKGAGKECEHLNPTPEIKAEVYERLLEIDRQEFGYDWIPNPTYAGDKCEMLFYNLFIDPMGDIQPCIGITHTLGNMKTHTLEEIWTSDFIRRTRNIDASLAGDCKECYYHKSHSCYGCAGRRFIAADGDVEAVFKTTGCSGFIKA